jgi:hypothetical protein
MSKRDQQKRLEKKGRNLSDFYNEDKVKEYFLFVVNETKNLSRYLNEILTFALAEKMSSRLYYEIFDLDTRGDRFRIEVSAGSYGIKMSIFVDGNLVIEDTAIYDIPKRAFTTPSIQDIANVLPSEYERMIDESRAERLDLDLWGRRRNNPRKGTSVLGALILGGIIGHSMKK